MVNFLQAVAISTAALMLSACGRVHSRVTTQPDELVIIKQVSSVSVKVTSEEQDQDLLELNEQWKNMATDELRSMLSAKRIASSDDGDVIVECLIEVVYGSRALRYFVGFGAGTGHFRVAIELKDREGKVRYSTLSEADLSVGAFGGSMDKVAKKSIKAAVKEFGSRL